MNNQQLPGHPVNSDIPLPDLLVQAVMSGHLETVNYLLSKGVDPDTACKHGHLALYLAAVHGHCDVVKALLVKGAAINGSRALIAASLAGSLEIVELLLAHGADPNIQTHHDGYTALHWAARCGRPDIVIALLNKGASLNKGNLYGNTALNLAACNGQTDTVKALLARGAGLANPVHVLWDAVLRGSLVAVKTLLACGANPNECPDALVTAVCIVRSGYPEIVKEFLAHGADPNALNCRALCQAFRNKNREIVKILLDHGASPSPPALVDAATLGYVESVQKLLDLGINSNAPSVFQNMALCKAAKNGHLDVVNVLLERGAGLDVVGEKGDVCLLAAYDDPFIYELLDDRARSLSKPLSALVEAVKGGDLANVEALLAHGADPDAHHQTELSALTRAVDSGRLDIVKTLLANGARPDKSPDALVEAVISKQWEIIKILLANGARPDTPDKDNRTALEQAELSGHFAVIRLLENHIHPRRPDSLLNIARTCIRTRLIKRPRGRGRLLSSSIAELPLPGICKEYVYGPLVPEAGSPEEYLKNHSVFSDAMRADISI